MTSASRYHPCYQSRPSMYIPGLIPRNFAELAKAVPIESVLVVHLMCAIFALNDSKGVSSRDFLFQLS